MNNQRELWIEFARTRDASLRERLILQYTPLVKYVIGRVALALPGTIDSDDLLQFGTIGLIKTPDRYDPSVGTKFETFADSRLQHRLTAGTRTAALGLVLPGGSDDERDSSSVEYFRVASVPVARTRRTQAAHHAGRGLARQGVGLT